MSPMIQFRLSDAEYQLYKELRGDRTNREMFMDAFGLREAMRPSATLGVEDREDDG